jgi:hypothetical protein
MNDILCQGPRWNGASYLTSDLLLLFKRGPENYHFLILTWKFSDREKLATVLKRAVLLWPTLHLCRNLPGGKERPALKADSLTAICEPIVYIMWEPLYPTTIWSSTACYRDSFAFTLLSTCDYITLCPPFFLCIPIGWDRVSFFIPAPWPSSL